jgi:hypothetical protein
MFPIHYHNEIKWTKILNRDVERFNHIFFRNISKELENVKANDIEVQKNKILFKGGMFRFVTNWNPLWPITEGYIEGLSSKDSFYVVSYYLNFKQQFVYSYLVLAGIFLFLMLTPLPLIGIICFMVIPVLAIVLGWFSVVFRFESFIQRVLKETKLQD